MTKAEIRDWQERIAGTHAMLPEICLSLRMAINGAADPWPIEEVRDCLNFLKRVITDWDYSRRVSKADNDIDEAVRLLVDATIRYVSTEVAE